MSLPTMNPELVRFTQWFSLGLDTLGVFWLAARVTLKVLPPTRWPAFRRVLGHATLVVGDITEHV